MAGEMFDGFDHTQYKDEVIARWGTDAYAKSSEWWNSQTDAERQAWKQHVEDLGRAWVDASRRGISPASDEAQSLAKRQFEWLRGVPGTPGGGAAGPTKEYFVGLAEMYVADERFAANYGGVTGATFVRDAMKAYAERNL